MEQVEEHEQRPEKMDPVDFVFFRVLNDAGQSSQEARDAEAQDHGKENADVKVDVHGRTHWEKCDWRGRFYRNRAGVSAKDLAGRRLGEKSENDEGAIVLGFGGICWSLIAGPKETIAGFREGHG